MGKSTRRLTNRLRQLRQDAGITQQDLADAAGITRQTVIAIEGEKYSPSLEVAFLIAEALGARLEEVFQLQDVLLDRVRRALAVETPTATVTGILRQAPGSLTAYEHYIRGLKQFRQFGPRGFAEAWEHFERAVEVDPRHAPALAGMGAIILGGWAMRAETTSDGRATAVAGVILGVLGLLLSLGTCVVPGTALEVMGVR